MRLVKLLSRGEGIRTLLWTFIKSFQVATSTLNSWKERSLLISGVGAAPQLPPRLPEPGVGGGGGGGVTQRRNEQHLGVETGLTLLLAAK